MRSEHDVDFGVLLGLAYETFVDELHAELTAKGFHGVGRTYGYVFRAIEDGALSITQLADRLGITTQGVTKLVNEMEASGYVERINDESDARVKRVRLNANGRAALRTARRFHATFERRLVSAHGQPTVTRLRRTLSDLVESSPGGGPAGRLLRPF